MSEEVLIPKMKRIDKSKRKIKIPWLDLLVIFFGVLLIIGSTFININIKHYYLPADIFTNKNLISEDFIKSFWLIPQIPVLMFVCSSLGKKMSFASVLIYIVAGLFFVPIFALGGGIKYVGQFGFGYLFGYLPAVLLSGSFLESEKYSFPAMIKAALCGVFTIHILGILYMIFIALIKHLGSDFITGWIGVQSGVKILYDFGFSFVLILIGKYIHSGLRFISD